MVCDVHSFVKRTLRVTVLSSGPACGDTFRPCLTTKDPVRDYRHSDGGLYCAKADQAVFAVNLVCVLSRLAAAAAAYCAPPAAGRDHASSRIISLRP